MVELPQMVIELARLVRENNGRAYLVGGCVRDGLLDRTPKDLDVEVHGLEEARLVQVLRTLGTVKEVGKAFGVYKLVGVDMEIDVSLPRRDSRTADRDPFLGEKAATLRRDLTINSLLLDPLTEELLDYFGGREDLRDGVLREVDSSRFGDDPLRALRAVRLGATLGFQLADSLRHHCKSMDLSSLPGERVWVEIDRMLMEPERPGDALYELHALGLVPSILPGLEGAGRQSVREHLNQAARLGVHLSDDASRRVLLVSVLLSPLKETAATRVLDRLCLHRWDGHPLRRPVLSVISELQRPLPVTDTALRKASERVGLEVFLRVWEALRPAEGGWDALMRAQEIGVAAGSLPELVRGEDLLALGFEPGPQVGAALKLVREAQLEGRLSSREDALVWIRNRHGRGTS
ncbi:MAG: hypothetical protein VX519_10375 [Myxococcota bacterium]|nr:hypothetical protein [Myxococcota bacterium]